MKLPLNMDHPTVEAAVSNAKQAFGSYALDCVGKARERGGSATGTGAIAMIGLLDAALEHFSIWHRAQGVALDEEQFLAFVRERLKLADANTTRYLNQNESGGALQ